MAASEREREGQPHSGADFSGVWNFDAAASENPEKLAELEGKGWLARKAIANATNIKLTITQSEGELHVKLESTLKNEEGTISLTGSEEVKEIDGHPTKVTAHFEEGGEVLVVEHRFETEGKKPAHRTITRKLEDGGKTLIQTTHLTVEGQSASVKRLFRKQ